jgi:uncharacterized membrane protein HdeD (DUF308 family)
MLGNLVRNWWVFALRGVCAIVFGGLAFAWPNLTGQALVLLFGLYALADGLLALVIGIGPGRGERWWGLILGGAAGIGIGVLTFIWPDTTALVLVYFIAAWLVTKGVFEVVAAVALRRIIAQEWALFLEGVVTTGLGVLLAAFPGAGLVGLVWTIGAYSLVAGAALLILAFRLHRISRLAERLDAPVR